MPDYESERAAMVNRQLAARGISEPVLSAMGRVPREKFIPARERAMAYWDGPLPIGEGQTISQPYIVALMIEALEPRPSDRALDVGAGSGYAAAILSLLVEEVYAIERLEPLQKRAGMTLEELGYDNVHVLLGDGSRGWPEKAPYDGIVVAAGAPGVPDALREQLTIGGRLVIPVGTSRGLQRLERITRRDEDHWESEFLADVRFVPLIGEQGWQ